MNTPSDNTDPSDHAKIVTHANTRLSWVWLFPLLALVATSWFFWTDWKTEGPKIQIEFLEAPGIQANKTLLFYRGVAAGKVIDVRLDKYLSKAVVTVRLKAFAKSLSQAGTLFWIDQPVISLAKTSGLSSIIQGNSIQARIGEGPLINYFVGIERMPLHPLEAPGLILKLTAQELPLLEEGSPINYRGVTIGSIMRKEITQDGSFYVIAAIQKPYKHLIHSNSRFWSLPAASFEIGPRGLRLDLLNLKGMFLGTVAIDTFEPPTTEKVENDTAFPLYANESAARAENDGITVRLNAKEIPMIYMNSPVLYHGITVGKVLKKELNQNNEPILTVLIKKAFSTSLRQNSTFWRLPATKVQAGPGILKIDISSLQSLVQGGIAYDVFGPEGNIAKEGSMFRLCPTEELAHLDARPFKMTFNDGLGLLAGQTQVRYLGLPIGLVQEIKLLRGKVKVTAYLLPGYDFLRQPGSTSTIIRSKVALDGVSGLETLVSGVYIECSPPIKKSRPVADFFARTWKKCSGDYQRYQNKATVLLTH